MRLLIPLFSPATGTWGGLTRVIAIAKAAQQAGHAVAFCASGYLEQTLRQRGYTVYATPSTTMLGLPRPLSNVLERRSQRVSLPVKPGKEIGNIWLVLTISGLARGNYLKRLVEAERKAALDFGANALFTDLDPGAFLLARITGLPIASAYASIITSGKESLPWRLMKNAMAGVLKSFSLPEQTPDELCFGPEVLKIIPSIPELDDTDPNRPDVYYVGELLGEIQAEKPVDFVPETGKRYVFAYLGTGSISMDTLHTVLPQVFPAGGQQLCLVGAQSISTVERIGAVEFRPYVPAEAVLPYCDWTICHGGQNTIIQSLVNGVPLLIFPGPIFERRYNARKVQVAGAGVMGESNEFNAGWLETVLAMQPSLAAQAVCLGERIRSLGGAKAAVAAMEAHVKNG